MHGIKMYKKDFAIGNHSGAVYAIGNGSGPHTIFSASADKHVVEWNIEKRIQEPFVVRLTSAAYSVHYDQLHDRLFIGNALGGLHVIDANSKKELHYFTLHTGGIYDMACDHRRNLLLVAGGDGCLSVWNLETLKCERNIPLCTEKLRQLAIHEPMDKVAVACGDGSVRVLELDFLNEEQHLEAHADGATAVAWHPAKAVLATGGKDAHLKMWSIQDNYSCALSVPAHNYAIYSIAFGHGICATASRDKTIKIWDELSFNPIQRLDTKAGGHSHSVNKLLFQHEYLISCGDDRQIICWKKDL